MLPVISGVATHRKHSSKNLQISLKIRSSHQKCSAKIGVLKSYFEEHLGTTSPEETPLLERIEI